MTLIKVNTNLKFMIMIKYLKTCILFFTVFFFVSCNAYQGINTAALEIGMSKSTVQAIVKKPMEPISSKINDGGVKEEVCQVQKRIVRGGIARQQRYYLFFADEKLVKYELADEKFSF